MCLGSAGWYYDSQTQAKPPTIKIERNGRTAYFYTMKDAMDFSKTYDFVEVKGGVIINGEERKFYP